MTGDYSEQDRLLIELLRANARSSYAELASAMGISSDAVRIRVERLVGDNSVKLITLIDPALIDRSTRVSVGIRTVGNPDDFIAWSKSRGEVVHLVRTLGRFTFFSEIILDSLEHAHRFVVEELSAAPGVVHTESWPILAIEKWRDDTGAAVVDFNEIDRLALAADDRSLVRELVANPRVQFRELAERVGRPYSVVRRRALSLLDAGVIRPTVVTQRANADSVQRAIVLVKSAGGETRLLGQEFVTILTSTAGTYQLIGEVAVPTLPHLKSIAQRLRAADAAIIDVEVLPYITVEKAPVSLQM